MADLRAGVPHVPDLANEGMAVPVAWTDAKKPADRRPTAYRLTPQGQQLIYDAMRSNAALALADPSQAPHRLVLGGAR